MKRMDPKKSHSAGKSVPEDVDEYLAHVPESARSRLNRLRSVIRSVVPAEATEVISYRIPAFEHDGILVWYAAFTKHCSLFPTASVIQKFKDELKSISPSKGTVHFPHDKPLPIALIKEMVRARVAESKNKKRR